VKIRTLGPRIRTLDARRVRPAPKRADPFYLTPEWRNLIDDIVRERGRRCEDPECRTPDRATRIFGDHIVELRDGGAPLDRTNILLRCGTCHTRKTLRERARRLARPTGGEGGSNPPPQ